MLRRAKFVALSALGASAASAQDTTVMKVAATALDNPYVRVSRDTAPCATAEAGVREDRIVVAMDNLELSLGAQKRRLKRGDVVVVGKGQSYQLPAGARFYEIAIKPGHPPVKSPPVLLPARNNKPLHDAKGFFVYEEKLGTGQTRERHSHSQRVEIRVNSGPMLHQWVWNSSTVEEIEPSVVTWREPITHTVRNIGTQPLRNVIVELKP